MSPTTVDLMPLCAVTHPSQFFPAIFPSLYTVENSLIFLFVCLAACSRDLLLSHLLSYPVQYAQTRHMYMAFNMHDVVMRCGNLNPSFSLEMKEALQSSEV